MEIEDILTDENVFRDALIQHIVNYFSLEEHDVIGQAVVPLSNQFNDSVAQLIVHVQDFEVKRLGAHLIPLRVDEIVVYFVCVPKLIVLLPEKRRPAILGGDVAIAPFVVRFYVVHVLAELVAEIAFTFCFRL